MTTPTTQPEETITLEALRKLLKDLHARIDRIEQGVGNIDSQYSGIMFEIKDLRADVESMRDGLQAAATRPQPADNAPTRVIAMVRMVKSRTKGKDYYKMQGGPWMQRGVSVWPEVLEALGLDPAALEWNAEDTHIFETPLNVTVQMQTYKDETTGEVKTGPDKVIGKG
jgi:hypothetical protein